MIITATDYAALPASLQTSFVKVDGGEDYTNGEEKAVELKSALDKEREARKATAKDRDALKAKADAAEAKAEEERLAALRKGKDVSALEEDYQKKLAASEARLKSLEDAAEAAKVDTVVSSAIKPLRDLFTTPSLVSDYLKSRVRGEVVDGETIVRVVDPSGKMTANSVEDLKKEILANEEFKGILVGSKGSGGGATATEVGGGATTNNTSGKGFDPNTASIEEMEARLTAKGIGAE